MVRRFLLATLASLLLGAANQPAPLKELDSQVVVNRYISALEELQQPANVVFSYSVSQAGVHNLEQTHRIFRSRSRQRDETISVDGDPVKMVRIVSHVDRYSIVRLAPRIGAYAFLFLGTHKAGKHLEYVYSTAPMSPSAFTVTEVTIDGITYLPTLIRFTAFAGGVHANGSVAYAKFSKYWMPVLATVSADVTGHPTRERIAWSSYSFPSTLPPSTFFAPKPLVVPTVAPF